MGPAVRAACSPWSPHSSTETDFRRALVPHIRPVSPRGRAPARPRRALGLGVAAMAERFFKKEVQKLYLGDGEEFRGEGILAVTKALLQSGVSYVAGYQ